MSGGSVHRCDPVTVDVFPAFLEGKGGVVGFFRHAGDGLPVHEAGSAGIRLFLREEPARDADQIVGAAPSENEVAVFHHGFRTARGYEREQ